MKCVETAHNRPLITTIDFPGVGRHEKEIHLIVIVRRQLSWQLGHTEK